MKYSFIIIGTLSLLISTSEANGQITYNTNHPEQFFEQGKEMFNNNNWEGCTDFLNQFKKTTSKFSLLEEADYMLAVAAYETNNPATVKLLTQFAKRYPWSIHASEIRFLTANSYFFNKNYQEAIEAYKNLDMNCLSTKDQEIYCYRLGLSYIKTDQIKEAKPFFVVLNTVGNKYKEAALFYSSYIEYAEKNYSKALKGFEQLENSTEFGQSTRYYIAQIYFTQGKYDQVIQLCESLIKETTSDEYNTEIYRLLGESYYAQSNDTQAVKYLKKYISETESPMRNSLYKLGIAEYRLGDYKQAIANLGETTKENDAMTQNAYLHLGLCYLKLGDKKNAQIAFDAASQSSFDMHVQEAAMYNYAMLIRETQTSPFGESVLILERLLNTFPQSRYSDQVNDYLVEAYLTSKNYNVALASINKIKYPSAKILEAKQNVLLQLGVEAFNNFKYEEAKKYLTDAILVGNYNNEVKAQAYFWRGESNYKLNDYIAAASDYNDFFRYASQKNSTYALAQYDLAYAYFKQHRFSEANRYFLRYIENASQQGSKSYADAYNRIGDCYFYQRDFNQAETYYNKAADVSPASADYALFQKGFVAGLKKDFNSKITSMDRLISNYPQSEYIDDAIFEKGTAYVALENNPKAITTFKQLIEKYPNSPISGKAGVQLGLLYFNDNNLDEAISAYKKVISSFPGSDEAKVAAQDLKSVYLEKNAINEYADYIQSLNGTIRFNASEKDSLTYLAAEKLYMRNNMPQAEQSFNAYLQSFENGAFNINAHYYLGNINYNAGNYEAALPHYEKVLLIPNNNFEEDALVQIADISTRNKEYQKALSYYTALETKASSAENKLLAKVGILRMSKALKQDHNTITSADNLLSTPNLSPEFSNEARFERALAYKNLNQSSKAVEDWKILSADSRNAYGAEATYLLAQYDFDNGNTAAAEKLITKFIENGTPHQYWLARGFILLADISIKGGDKFQAKQYLVSLKNNYQGEDDIKNMIQDRLKQIGE